MSEQEKYLESLIDLGLKSQEAKIYLACLKLGQSTVGNIADEADVQRTFVYDILDNLHEKGIVSKVLLRGKMHFSVISIDQFKKLQQSKLDAFEKLLPEFKAIEKTVGDRPKVRFYEGREGLKIALQDTLNQEYGGEIFAYATGEGFYDEEKQFINDYLKQRIKKRISVRALGPDNPINRDYVAHDKEQLRETRLVPQDIYPFTNEIDIYGNKLLIMSLQGELLAVIIESESIAKTQRAIFELAWRGAATTKSSQ